VPTIARPDMSVLRSVRSDAYRAGPVDAATAAAAAAAAASGSARVVRSANVDDLKRIRGVGVLIERKLNSVGVVNYSQIGQWTKADVDKISQILDFKGRIERENWIEQARILSSGGQTEFSRRVDRGEVETSKSKE
jgi:predicted flap endonuclease-1-like 5' DNA nuclease